ncbi:TolC family protein [Massilia sp. YIM B02763]|uniref:TolC family protein n=1 Tax=Massilia sp. YIM B02763 TaxID=3050130 RepID=UPI0025B68FAA|nr:TolC family protein [Massilia sp. YIM B02763]MDN4053040.1 TolC family protein [Massilia sp. YIM B02763]
MHIHSRRLRVLAAALVAWCGGAVAQPHGPAPSAMAAVPTLTPAPQPAAALDLQAAIALALERHPLLRAAGHDVAAGEADVDQAGRLPNPELAWLREGEQAGSRTTTVQINQPIEFGGKRGARVKLAEGELALARTELALRRQAIRADVIDAYCAVLAARERQHIADATTALAARSTGVASGRVAAGKVSPIEAAKARLAQAEAKAEGERALAELAVARTQLAQLVGDAAAGQPLAPIDADALPEAEPLDALLRRGLDAAADVRRAQGRLAVQRAQADVERAARIPDLTLSVGSQRDDQAGRHQAVVGIAVPLPLFDRNGGRLAAARERGARAEAELEAARDAARAELGTAHARYRQARAEAQLLERDVVPEARSVYELTLKGFEYGKFGFLDVLDAQRTWFQVRSRSWQALRDAWRARAELERLAGPAQPLSKAP